jgi:AcrR family transcriptional regulator
MPDTPRAPSAPRRRGSGPPTAPYDARDAHEIRRQILDASHDLLVQRGYEHFSLREVARALGKSSGSPYRHFPTKQELVWTMMEEALGSIYAAVRAAAERAGPDPAARFEAMARAYVAYGLDHPTHYEVVFLLHAAAGPALPAERLQGGRLTLELVAELIEAGTRAGVLRTGAPGERPLVTAGVIWATLHGAVSIAIGNRLVPGQNLTTGELVEATVRSLLARYVVPASERAVSPAPAR